MSLKINNKNKSVSTFERCMQDSDFKEAFEIEMNKLNDEESKIEVIKNKPGPVSLYEPWMGDKIIEIAGQGGHISAMLVALGIRSKDTFYRWLKEYPEFNEAYEYSKIVSQELHEKIQLEGALGRIPHFNPTTFAMIMNNKFGDDYKRSGTGSNTEITVNTLNLSAEDIEQKIAQKIEKLKLLGVKLD